MYTGIITNLTNISNSFHLFYLLPFSLLIVSLLMLSFFWKHFSLLSILFIDFPFLEKFLHHFFFVLFLTALTILVYLLLIFYFVNKIYLLCLFVLYLYFFILSTLMFLFYVNYNIYSSYPNMLYISIPMYINIYLAHLSAKRFGGIFWGQTFSPTTASCHFLDSNAGN